MTLWADSKNAGRGSNPATGQLHSFYRNATIKLYRSHRAAAGQLQSCRRKAAQLHPRSFSSKQAQAMSPASVQGVPGPQGDSPADTDGRQGEAPLPPPTTTPLPQPSQASKSEAARAVTLDSEPLLGQDKWLGGSLGDDGAIYGIPGTAREVLKVDPVSGEVSTFGGPLIGKFKWLRGVSAGGDIYCIPANAESVLVIHPGPEPSVSLVGKLVGDWMYHGGVLAPDGCIYGVPCNATNVLKITPGPEPKVETFGELPEMRQKWYGGILASDGCIYCIPNCSDKVLKIIPGETPRCELFGELPGGGYKYHGGCMGADGRIYGFPAHADDVLCIEPGPDPKAFTFGGPLGTGKWRPEGKYKYGGGTATPDGPMYAFPSDAARVLKILPIDSEEEEKVTMIGPSFDNAHNKWQNGYYARDKCVYAIPLNGGGPLQINSVTDEVQVLDCLEGMDKWEGGVEGPDGALYCMPLRSKKVVKIVPGPEA
eukprot:gene20571-27365_t